MKSYFYFTFYFVIFLTRQLISNTTVVINFYLTPRLTKFSAASFWFSENAEFPHMAYVVIHHL